MSPMRSSYQVTLQTETLSSAYGELRHAPFLFPTESHLWNACSQKPSGVQQHRVSESRQWNVALRSENNLLSWPRVFQLRGREGREKCPHHYSGKAVSVHSGSLRHVDVILLKGKLVLIFQKKADNLQMTEAELSVVGIQNEIEHDCFIKPEGISNKTETFICEIKGLQSSDIDIVKVNAKFMVV